MSRHQAELARGAALHRARKFDDAIACCEAVLAEEPGNTSAMHLAGMSHLSAGRGERAVALFRHCLALRPDFPEALTNLSRALLAQDKAVEALKHCHRACELAPTQAVIHANLGNILHALGRNEAAAAAYSRALSINPNLAGAYSGRGTALKFLGRFEEALADYDQALERVPDSVEFWNNRANVLCDLKRFDQAETAYARALALKPDSPDVLYNRSLSYLLRGEFERGWVDFESRWSRVKGPRLRTFPAPRWTGREPLRGRTILLHGEQGFGDTLQFARYAQILAQEHGAEVILEVQRQLVPLLTLMPDAKGVFALGESTPSVDFECPLMSVPRALGTRVESIPASVPYLAAPPDLLEFWQGKLKDASRPRVGLVWAGNPHHPNDHVRSIPLARLLDALTGLPGSFYSLQKVMLTADRTLLKATPELVDLTPQVRDFADTAAIVSNLDLILTVDTAVAHLAGALGRPTWVFLPYAPDWRWLLDRTDSPWYPSLKLSRQPAPNDWAPAFTRMRALWPTPERSEPEE